LILSALGNWKAEPSGLRSRAEPGDEGDWGITETGSGYDPSLNVIGCTPVFQVLRPIRWPGPPHRGLQELNQGGGNSDLSK
jgi:hypothetical protein